MTYDSKTNTITLGSDAHKTDDTLVDLGLSFVHNLRAFAARPTASKSLSSDWKLLEAWLGCAGREFNQDDLAKIGDAFRSYFAKGISPSAKLESTFQHFAERAKRQNRLCVAVPPQIEQVFDRMFATDEEIQAKKRQEPQRANTPAPLGKVTHYANNKRMCCCSITLLSGERIMISIAAAPTPSVKIMKMGFMGIFPVKTLWEYNPTMAGGYDAYLRKMMLMFQDFLATEPKHPLDILRDRLLPCKSISEVRDSLFNAEHSVSG